jgi:hypothetical protein
VITNELNNEPRPLGAVAGWLVGLITICLVSASCGFDVQTNRPYTPADGVHVDGGAGGQVQVRNLLIISAEPGEGILSATIYATRPDQLVAVNGTADALDGDGAPLTATLPAPITVRPQNYVELTELPSIVVRSNALEAGLTAQLTLQFRDAGQATIRVPVMAADISYYESIRPLAT